MSRSLPALFALLLALSAAPAAGAAPRAFFGIQAWQPPSPSDINRLGRAGIGTYRAQFNWGEIEWQPGRRNWQAYDALVERASRARVTVLPVLLGSPGWAASRPQNPPETPAAHAAYLAWVADVVGRYGPSGTFWPEHPGVPRRPIRHWQVWNEPNFPAYWFDRPNASQYVAFVRDTRAAVLSRDPGAKIVLAGLPETRKGVLAATFLRRIYRVPGAAQTFDVVALHAYAKDHRGVMGAIRRGRRIMRQAGDARTPIWLTELGWSTGGLRSRFTTNERGQARRLGGTLRALLRARRRLGVGMLVWFSLHDRRPFAGERDWWALHTGLFRLDGSAKPAWRVLNRYAPG